MTAKSEDDESYPRHVYKSLYKVIERYAECCFCGLSDPSPTTPRKSHWGRLELKGKYPTIENEILFHSVFSKKGLIEFITSTSEFCKLLSEDIGPASKDVRIGDEVLLVFNHAVGIEVDIADERSLPLTDVLGQYSLVPKTKLLLAYILAKSVWQFYNSDFMSVWWTPESIHLFRERETEEVDDEEPGVDWAPYYAFSSKQPQGEHCEERLKHGYFIHRYPRVLALGLLLYEIGRKRRRGSRTTISPTAPVEFPTIAKIINATSHKINIGMGKKEWPDIKLHDPEALANYQLVVKNCVDPSFFKPILQKGSLKTPEELEEELTIEERRAILYRKVVEPLKKLVQSAGWVDESGSIERRHVKGAAARKKEEPISQNTGSAKLLHPPQDFSDMTQDTYTALEAKAKAWLDEIKKSPVTATVLSAFEVNNEPEVNRIRIVVLDTGYDPNAIFFVNKQRTRRLKGWKDYVETDQPDPKDEDGHGTHVVSVLMKVAPAADIYFARVARGSRDLEKAAGNVAEAIEWAWKDCEADIVTMSFGFHEEIYIEDKPVISNAILEALRGTDQRILFFAAAANDGGNRQEMFPASDMHVLSIRGTDEYGWAQPFNPPPDYNGKTCFMTLGIQVPGASLCSSEDGGADVCRNGTSVATPIAAGIAAMLLGYTRIYEEKLREILGREDEAKLVRIWNITGMSMLFEKMASKMDNKCSFLHINKLTERSHRMRLGLIADAAKEATG
ncbi:peptidase S8/S53, subtilisin/kexin/sedolisin [Hyaloscypha finlandica]|nr:peptidase S8/S53, subtilisin/kexin/sedolisin [Hyaloscypha finlandica]